MFRFVALALALVLPACSYSFVQDGSDLPRERYVAECTPDSAAPVGDALLTALGGVVVVSGVHAATYDSGGSEDESWHSIGAAGAIVGGVVAIVAAASFYHGVSATSKCRAARRAAARAAVALVPSVD